MQQTTHLAGEIVWQHQLCTKPHCCQIQSIISSQSNKASSNPLRLGREIECHQNTRVCNASVWYEMKHAWLMKWKRTRQINLQRMIISRTISENVLSAIGTCMYIILHGYRVALCNPYDYPSISLFSAQRMMLDSLPTQLRQQRSERSQTDCANTIKTTV